MTPEPLDESYFEWLAVQVVNPRLRNPNTTYWLILKQLFANEFVWRVRGDNDRVEDGKELRQRFLEEYPNVEPTQEWLTQGCSFLEMLIALSGRLAFQTEGISPTEWFWHMLGNVNLVITDRVYESDRMEMFASQVLSMINNRTYDKNGRGGLFPLRESGVDQATVGLWYQMNYYLIEGS